MAFEVWVEPSQATMNLGDTRKFRFDRGYDNNKDYLTRVKWTDWKGTVLSDKTSAFDYQLEYEATTPGGNFVRLYAEGWDNTGHYSKFGVLIDVILPELVPKPNGIVLADPNTIRVGETAAVSISTVNVPTEDTEVTYTWKVDGVVDAGETGKVFNYRGRTEGRFRIECLMHVDKEGFTPVTVTDYTFVTVEPALEILVTIDTPKSIYHIGERCVFTAHPANLPEGVHALYTWYKDAEQVQSTGAVQYAFDITEKGEFDYKCIMTYLGQGHNGTADSNIIDIHVINADQNNVTAGLLASSVDGVVNEPIDLSVRVIGQPQGAKLTYVWYIDGSIDPVITGSTHAFVRSSGGGFSVFVEVTSELENFNPIMIKTQLVELQIRDYILAGVTVAPTSMEVEIGEEAKLTAIVDEVPEDTEVTFNWSCNGSRDFTQVTSEYTCDTAAPGNQTIEVHVEMTNINYLPTIKTSSGDVMVKPTALPDGDEFPFYVHPLPVRQSAYIWCGWWVMYEIQDLTKEGKNWKTDESGSYWLHRKTLAMMLDEFPEVDVQESRNGYIIHRSALEAGIIY